MHQYRIRALFDRGLDQRLARGYPANDVLDPGVRFDLQTVRAIVAELACFQVFVAELLIRWPRRYDTIAR
jgi:hypothetical protein